MGRTGHNIINMKKIHLALDELPDKFTSNDMNAVTGIGVMTLRMLLRQLPMLENIGKEPGMIRTTWRKIV